MARLSGMRIAYEVSETDGDVIWDKLEDADLFEGWKLDEIDCGVTSSRVVFMVKMDPISFHRRLDNGTFRVETILTQSLLSELGL